MFNIANRELSLRDELTLMMTFYLYNLHTVSESHFFTTMNFKAMPYSFNNCRESCTVIFCLSFVELFIIAGWARSSCQCEVHSSRSTSQNSHCILYGKSIALCIVNVICYMFDIVSHC